MPLRHHHIATAALLLFLLTWNSSPILAQNNCCEGSKNFLLSKRCQDGTKVTGVNCTRKYMLSNGITDNFTITKDGKLIMDDGSGIEKDQYCMTREGENGPEIVLACFPEVHVTETSEFITFRGVCLFISVLFLTATIVVYLLVPSLRDMQGKCLLVSITALDLAMIFLGILQFEFAIEGPACHIIGYIVFATFLVAFTWLNIISFHIWRTTVAPTGLGTNKQWYFLYNLWGYGVPLVIVCSAIIGHHIPGDHIKPGIGNGSCWFPDNNSTWAYFYGPIAFLLFVNAILFVWTVKTLWKDMKSATNCSKIKSLKYKCLLYIKLFFIMGLSWIFEIISFAVDTQNNFIDYIWMITDFMNVLQGVLIFLILIVFRKRALRGLAKRGCICITLPEQWKTLEDEECSEDVEEKHLAKDEQDKPKGNQS